MSRNVPEIKMQRFRIKWYKMQCVCPAKNADKERNFPQSQTQ